MKDQKTCYRKIMEEIWGQPMIPMEEWDWVEFSQDLEQSLRELPITGHRCRKVKLSLAAIVMMRGKGMKRKEIAPLIGCGIERVRQIESKAWRLLRRPSRSGRLRKWTQDLSDLIGIIP